MSDWDFETSDPDSGGFGAPEPLASVIAEVPDKAGVYVVSCGGCLAHVGTSGGLRSRLRTLARLGHHRGTAEVLCAAFCTKRDPLVRWKLTEGAAAARVVERRLKTRYGEPPAPGDEHAGCKNGMALRKALTAAAGANTWEAGYIEALFDVGEDFKLLEVSRFHRIWRAIGAPPGPWALRLVGDE